MEPRESSLLSDNIPIPDEFEDSLLGHKKAGKAEPDENDFAELDALLKESVRLHAAKTTSVGGKKAVQHALFEREKAETFKVLQHIAVWTSATCKCGEQSPPVFVRYMREVEKNHDRSNYVRWETIAFIPADQDYKDTIVKREVEMCTCCAMLCEQDLLSFEEVVYEKAD